MAAILAVTQSIAVLRYLADALLAGWAGAAIPPDKPGLANVRLRGNVAAFFGPDSYPDAARDAGEQGRVVAQLTVGRDGRVTACRITDHSGSASLDGQTCRIALNAVRFDPARDYAGRATASTYLLRVRWVLPSE